MASRKAPGKKAGAKKATKKKAAPKKAAKKAAKKKAAKKAPAKKKAAKKKAPAKKNAAPRKAAKKKAPAKKKAAKKKTSRARRTETRAAPELLNGELIPESSSRRKRPASTLPPDHEVLTRVDELRGEPVDKNVAIEAIRAAFEAEAAHPLEGKEHIGPRGRNELPKEGDLDYALAQEAQAAAREIIEADSAARARAHAVDERIAKIYSEAAREVVDAAFGKPEGLNE